MNRNELHKKEKKIAFDFLEKFKANFDIDKLESKGDGEYKYDNWKFRNVRWNDKLSEFYVTCRDDHHNDLHLNGGRKFKRKLKDFLVINIEQREEQLSIKLKSHNLDEIQNQIISNFPNSVDTFNSLNNHET